MNTKQAVTENFFRLWGHMETLQGEPICDGSIDILRSASSGNYAAVGRLQTDKDGYYDVVLPVEEGIEYRLSASPSKQEATQRVIPDNAPVKEIVGSNRDTFYENLTYVDAENFPYRQI